jgi:hypothetical protein
MMTFDALVVHEITYGGMCRVRRQGECHLSKAEFGPLICFSKMFSLFS